MTQERIPDEDAVKARKQESTTAEPKQQPAETGADVSGLRGLQQSIGNRAVQRLLVQRAEEGPFELDDKTESRINQERGGGQPLDGAVQAKMANATGHDFSGVRVHTSPEASQLNRQLGAKAFTTGQDIFFKGGAYDPSSSGGQELIAHELTHVVQQRSGAVNNGGGMTVNAPDDAFEHEAESVSKTVMSGGSAPGVQRQEDEEEEKAVQTQADEEEEKEVQTQADEEEEEEATT